MKRVFKSICLCAAVLPLTLLTFACAPDKDVKNDAAEQVEAAQETYASFYGKDGFFSLAADVPVKLAASINEGGSVSYKDVSERLTEYSVKPGIMQTEFNSYVADIFAYSQVQSSVLKNFGEQSLNDVYYLTYDTVNWVSDKTGYGEWIRSTRLRSAAFSGADLDSGRIYCTQSHVSRNDKVLANVEYYYNSDSDMGVTTLNWRDDGVFEYHFCSAGTYEILRSSGKYSDDGAIRILDFSFARKDGELRSAACSDEDEEFVLDFIRTEIERIKSKIDELHEQNERKRILDGTETGEAEEEHISVCSVELDFEILSKMLV